MRTRFLLPFLLTVSITGGALAGFIYPAAAADDLPEPFADTSRLVSIGGSLTEIVFALGHGQNMVGRDTTSTFPPEVSEITDVGYSRQLAPEGVLSVAPSAILLLEGSGPPEAIDVLQKAHVPMVAVPETFTGEGVLAKIRHTGAVLGEKEKAETLAAKVAADIEAAEKLTADVAERVKVLFILSMEGGRVLASGSGTAANGMIEMAGGVNAVEGYQGYKQISDEVITQIAPDVILMMDRGEDLDATNAELMANPALAATPAVANGRIIRMDGSYLLGFGPRTGAAVKDLAQQLYGDQVTR